MFGNTAGAGGGFGEPEGLEAHRAKRCARLVSESKNMEGLLHPWDWHPYPVTMPTGLVEALRKSLERMMAEGLPSRFQRHAEVAAFLRQGLRNLGLEDLGF